MITVAAVPDADNDDYHAVVLERADQTVIPDAVFPELAQCPLQALADPPRIVERFYPLVQEAEDSVRDGLAELFQFAAGATVKLNLPGHVGA